jgi:hypothetical protein
MVFGSSSPRVLPFRVRPLHGVERVGPMFRAFTQRFGTLLRAIRVHQWAKNLLVFVPALAAH